ncbi:hypothetical protein OWV82_010332 [Melia azedarach]|uniref:Uncharacterized protein n=1 Tax=Melia azedarach TaxID=155640 RepID=A0ACC1Y500_MELAZ|nr:hypothetical protein OWV82_010332 [Melia azedarach]
MSKKLSIAFFLRGIVLLSSVLAIYSDVSLQQCQANLSEQCGVILSKTIFQRTPGDMDIKCCRELLDMGQSCHDKFVNISLAKHPGLIPYNIWNDCQLVENCIKEYGKEKLINKCKTPPPPFSHNPVFCSIVLKSLPLDEVASSSQTN